MVDDINKDSREREIMYLRYAYYFIGYTIYKLSINSLAKELRQTHATGINAIKRHYSNLTNNRSIYKYIFHNALTKLQVSNRTVRLDYTEIVYEICDRISELPLDKIQEFADTRLDPYLRMNLNKKVQLKKLCNKWQMVKNHS